MQFQASELDPPISASFPLAVGDGVSAGAALRFLVERSCENVRAANAGDYDIIFGGVVASR